MCIVDVYGKRQWRKVSDMANTELLPTKKFRELYNHLVTRGTWKPATRKVDGKLQKVLEYRLSCDHTLCRTIDWMRKQEIVEIRANIEKIYALGGHCDCEILFNVSTHIWGCNKNKPLDIFDYIEWSDDPEKEWKGIIDRALAV
jgi:hypothetical protein